MWILLPYQYAELTHHLFKKTYRCCALKTLLAAALFYSPFDVQYCTYITNLGVKASFKGGLKGDMI
jgi:hypothetical protein